MGNSSESIVKAGPENGFERGGEEGCLAALSGLAGLDGSLLNVSELLSHFCILLLLQASNESHD